MLRDHSQKGAKRVPKPDVVNGYMEIASSALNIAATQMNPQCMWQHSQDCVTLHLNPNMERGIVY